MIHLHKDYHTSWCGLDVSYIPATHDPAACTCTDCASAYSTTLSADEAEALAASAQAQADNERITEALAVRAEKVAAMFDQPEPD